MDYQYLLFAHLLGMALFLSAHGVSMFFTAALRRERNPDRLRSILDLSLSALAANYLGLLLLIGSGIWMGVDGGFWGRSWLWTSVVVLVGMLAFMIFMGVSFFSRVRTAVGLAPYRQTRQMQLGQQASPEQLDTLLSGPQPRLTMAVGLLGLLILIALMVLKPF